MNLREDKHWSYGAGTKMVSAIGQRPFMSVAPVQTDKTSESLQELVKEYADMTGARPITARELKDAQDDKTLSLPGSFETASQLSSGYATILQYQLPQNYYNTFTEKALAITLEQANALAARTIMPNKLIWVVVGDMSKAEPGIRALNLGEVRKIDVDGNPLK